MIPASAEENVLVSEASQVRSACQKQLRKKKCTRVRIIERKRFIEHIDINDPVAVTVLRIEASFIKREGH